MEMCIPSIHDVSHRTKSTSTNLTKNTHQLNNDTDNHDFESNIFLSSVAVFVVITNFALIIGLRKTNKKLTISQKLYIYLSLTDTIVGLVGLPYFVIMHFLSLLSCTSYSIGMVMSLYSFGTGLGTFLGISYLRNLAIRKPLHNVRNKHVYLGLAVWNIYIVLKSISTFFVYHPRYASYYLSCAYWLWVGLCSAIEVFLVLVFNIWSTKVLARQSFNHHEMNDVDQRRRKRNQKAVGILNMISLVYALCTFPVSLYYTVLGILLSTYDHNKELFDFCYNLFPLIHLPLFFCSGFNALVYMLKDKDIRKYYSSRFCCKKNRQDSETS